MKHGYVPPNNPQAQQEASIKLGCPSFYEGKEKRYSYNDVWLYIPDERILTWEQLKIGEFLNVEAETGNQYDPNAVVITLHGYIVGYLYKKDRRYSMANDWFRQSLPMLAQVESIDKQNNKLTVIIAFYDVPKLERMLRYHPNPKPYRLSRSANEEAQDAIMFCSEGDEVTIEDDFDSDGYVIRDVGIMGKLPISAAKIVDEYGGANSCCAFVANKDYTDNGKETVSVYIFKA